MIGGLSRFYPQSRTPPQSLTTQQKNTTPDRRTVEVFPPKPDPRSLTAQPSKTPVVTIFEARPPFRLGSSKDSGPQPKFGMLHHGGLPCLTNRDDEPRMSTRSASCSRLRLIAGSQHSAQCTATYPTSKCSSVCVRGDFVMMQGGGKGFVHPQDFEMIQGVGKGFVYVASALRLTRGGLL